MLAAGMCMQRAELLRVHVVTRSSVQLFGVHDNMDQASLESPHRLLLATVLCLCVCSKPSDVTSPSSNRRGWELTCSLTNPVIGQVEDMRISFGKQSGYASVCAWGLGCSVGDCRPLLFHMPVSCSRHQQYNELYS